MVGKGVLLECLDHQDISEVLSISRVSTGVEHSKLKELLHQDFSDFTSKSEQLKGYDACYACMGVSSAGIDEEAYTKLTYDFTLALANELFIISPDMTYTYVSGQGTDTTEKGRVMWARVKGKTENDVLKLGFRQAFVFRPGMIVPKRGVTPKAEMTKMAIKYLGWLLKVMKKITPKSVVDTIEIGQAMIAITQYGYHKSQIDIVDIQGLAKRG